MYKKWQAVVGSIESQGGVMEIKKSILRHLNRHGRDCRWIRQRKLRDCIHAESAELFNQAAIELAQAGTVELDADGPYHKRVIRLKPAAVDEKPTAVEMPTV